MIFKAYAVTNELELNTIAAQCRLPRKYTWEEPLILQKEVLKDILGRTVDEMQRVMVFAFGSIVFINTTIVDENVFFKYLKTIKPELEVKFYQRYNEDYELREIKEWQETGSENLVLTDQYVVVSEIQTFHAELIATVIAKSVALEKTEVEMEKILDRLEETIDRLEKAKLKISDRELARTIAKVIRHEYNSIAYIMILDKPDITWTNLEAAYFYDQMSIFFELNDRFEILKKKTDILHTIINHFSTISHSMRGLFIEWLIVALILAEVILMIAGLLK